MLLTDVPFRWLTMRPIMIDLRRNEDLYARFQADALVICLWIDEAGFLQAGTAAGVSLENGPHVIRWLYEEIPVEEVLDCRILPGVLPKEDEQERIWKIRNVISDLHPVPRELIQVRRSTYLDRYRDAERPDLVLCHCESENGGEVLVHTDGFSGTELLGTVVEDDAGGLLHENDKVMIYTCRSAHYLLPILIATKIRYE